MNVTIWHEHRHEKSDPKVAEVYPEGIHGQIAAGLKHAGDLKVTLATLDDPEHGLGGGVLEGTDVLIWWGHMAHDEVADETVNNVYQRVMAGMGLVALHSGHMSKIFMKLMGTTCNLKWREADDREILWVTRPGHPIVEGIDDHFILPREEMYGEFFDIPEPDETVLISTFTGGECFRSGLVFKRGAGTIFYFRPGHETYPTYYDPNVLRVIENGIRYVAPKGRAIAPVAFGNKKQGWLGQ